ncbi:MAG: threonylcarbamoyl-AMP synthase [Synergistaceae bacterium]|nr:threonylcarbamoyl-AMP synthase [Synergistaceae bacterium]
MDRVDRKLTKVDRRRPDRDTMEKAASIIKEGGLVAFPTETVYGLGADGMNPAAVGKIFAAKGRPSDNPLILHLSSPDGALGLARLDGRALAAMRAFWPGPLTIVLPALSSVPREVTAGLSTVALRMPDHPVALALIEASGCPIAAPSANRSGRPSPTDAQAVVSDLGDAVDLVLDAGAVDIGLESTVIDASGEDVLLLRPGGTPLEALEEFFGAPIKTPGSGAPEARRSPGTRHRHYAPIVPVRIWTPCDALIAATDKSGFVGRLRGGGVPPGFARAICFDSAESYASGLFAAFRALERDCSEIVAEWPEADGVGLALRDRIRRAASPDA